MNDTILGDAYNNYELILTKFDDIHSILRKGSYVGFAIPLGSGLFKVARFSLNGSDKAFDYVVDKATKLKSGETFL